MSYFIFKTTVERNYLTNLGFALACTMLYRLAPVSITTEAPVCSSWGYMARSKTQRSPAYPLGNPHFINVYHANVMVARLCLHLLFLAARGLLFIVEQPGNSIIFQHPRMQQVLAALRLWTYTLDLRRLGHHTKKPTTLYTNFEWITGLADYFYEKLPPTSDEQTCFKCIIFML